MHADCQMGRYEEWCELSEEIAAQEESAMNTAPHQLSQRRAKANMLLLDVSGGQKRCWWAAALFAACQRVDNCLFGLP